MSSNRVFTTDSFDGSVNYRDRDRRWSARIGVYGVTAILTTGLVVVALAMLFYAAIAPVIFWFSVAGSVVLVIAGGAMAAQALRVRRVRANLEADQISHLRRRLEAETRQAEAEAERALIENETARTKLEQEIQIANRMGLEKYLFETKAAVITIGEVFRDARIIPVTASERREMGLLAAPQPAETPAPLLDFYTAMTGTRQAYKIIAEQRRGKSYLAMLISDYVQRNRLGVNIVIGTKHERGEWPNCRRFLGDSVAYGLEQIIAEVGRRHRAHQKTPLLRVYLDDWINTVIEHPALALEFLDLAATKMVSAGIVPYFLLQGDGNDDWGSRRSAMLKNNFTGLWVRGPRDANGDPLPAQNEAHIVYPGSRDELPVRLPADRPQVAAGPLSVVRPKAAAAAPLAAAAVELCANPQCDRPAKPGSRYCAETPGACRVAASRAKKAA